MAAAILYRRAAGIAGAVCALACKRIGGLAAETPRHVGRPAPRYSFALETAALFDGLHDGHESGRARYAGYVPHVSAAAARLYRVTALVRHGNIDGGRHPGRLAFRSALGPLRPPPIDDCGAGR